MGKKKRKQALSQEIEHTMVFTKNTLMACIFFILIIFLIHMNYNNQQMYVINTLQNQNQILKTKNNALNEQIINKTSIKTLLKDKSIEEMTPTENVIYK
jgi:hypothetical protein